MSSWKKVLLGGAAVAALSSTAAFADFTATLESNSRLAGTTGNLQFDLNNGLPIAADGTIVIDDFAGAVDELQQGNQITLTLSDGVFNVLPINTTSEGIGGCPAAGPGGTGTLNFQAGGAGSSFVTYEIDQADIEMDAPSSCTITFSNIVVRNGSYNSTSGSQIDITLSDLAGELTGVTSGGGLPDAGNDDLTETLFTFQPGTTTQISPDGTDNEVTFGPLASTSGSEEPIDLNPPSLGELFVIGGGGTDTSTALGVFVIDEDNVIDGNGDEVDADDILVTVEGPFSDGIGEIFLTEYNAGGVGLCPAAAGGYPTGTIVGDTATFTGLDALDVPFDTAPNDLGSTDGTGRAEVQVCVLTDSGVQNGTLLLAGQYSVDVEITTDAGTTEGDSGDIDETVYENGKITRIAYAFGGGAGYSWFMPVTTMTASPIIVLVKDDDGNEWSGVLEDPALYPSSNTGGVQDENTHVLYTAGDINSAVGGTPLDDETTRAGIWVFSADNATVGSTMLNPTGDLGAVNTYEGP